MAKEKPRPWDTGQCDVFTGNSLVEVVRGVCGKAKPLAKATYIQPYGFSVLL